MVRRQDESAGGGRPWWMARGLAIMMDICPVGLGARLALKSYRFDTYSKGKASIRGCVEQRRHKPDLGEIAPLVSWSKASTKDNEEKRMQ